MCGWRRQRCRADIDAELAIDLLFGSIVFRLFNGLAPIDTDNAVELAHMALRAIRAPSVNTTTTGHARRGRWWSPRSCRRR